MLEGVEFIKKVRKAASREEICLDSIHSAIVANLLRWYDVTRTLTGLRDCQLHACTITLCTHQYVKILEPAFVFPPAMHLFCSKKRRDNNHYS